MNKKGFTLIELLAVIVILAIIALIATPIILNIIEKARKSAFQDSAYGLIETARLEYTEGILDGDYTSKTYIAPFTDLKFSGSKPSGGTISVGSDGKIAIAIHNNRWCALKEKSETVVRMIAYEENTCKLTGVETPPTITKENVWVKADPKKHGDDGANVPTLKNGLIPVKYVTAEDKTTKWYDYNKQMWANAVAVSEEYRNVAVGTEIPESAILGYFVWIPRYEYQYTDLGNFYAGGTKINPGEIKVKWIGKDVTTATTNYKVHPAFTFGTEELAGIWIGKFETTGTGDSPTIKPNITSLRNQNVSTQFATAQKLSANGNHYGIKETADSHMMKNSEWGAVAYLSQSKYGKYGNPSYNSVDKKIYQNKSDGYITGCSSGGPAILDTGCPYTYNQGLEGTGASTTGTIYGIYDMSGGAFEYMMGEYGKVVGNSGFSTLPNEKYYDNYIASGNAATLCANGICYGHALSETSEWYNAYANVCPASSWLERGSHWSDSSTDRFGVFHYSCDDGRALDYYAFRISLLD